MGAYFASLNFASLPARMPSAIAQGILWGLMALGVYITFRLLDVADLSVDGSFATGGAVTVMLIISGWPAWAALLAALLVGVLAGLCTGLLHTKLGIPAILAGILSGVLTTLCSVLALSLAFRLSHEEYVTLLPKSITTAIGMGVSEELGGYVTLTVAMIIITGILGNVIAVAVCRVFRITEPIAKGVAIGSAAHALGTAKAIEIGEVEGAMSGLSIVVAGLLTVAGASVFANFL